MTSFLINPSGPVGRATIDNAYANMTALLTAAGVSDAPWRRNVDAREDRGYFEFFATLGGCDVPISMPGCSLERLKLEDLSAPRVYVGGSSWWWKIAIDVVRYEGSGRHRNAEGSSR